MFLQTIWGFHVHSHIPLIHPCNEGLYGAKIFTISVTSDLFTRVMQHLQDEGVGWFMSLVTPDSFTNSMKDCKMWGYSRPQSRPTHSPMWWRIAKCMAIHVLSHGWLIHPCALMVARCGVIQVLSHAWLIHPCDKDWIVQGDPCPQSQLMNSPVLMDCKVWEIHVLGHRWLVHPCNEGLQGAWWMDDSCPRSQLTC